MPSFWNWLLGAAIVAPILASPAGAAPNLVPHQADYGLRLIKTLPGSGVADARGTIEYRFEKMCDGWVSENRTFLSLRDTEGQVHQSAYLFITWESLDGSEFRFRIRHLLNGELTDESAGEARSGPEARASFSIPDKEDENLPADVMFPTDHLRLLLAEAEQGTRLVSRQVFDGSVDNPLNRITAFIHAGGSKEGKGEGLANDMFTPMRMAFFDPKDQEAEPMFELSIDYAANGFTNRLVQDYGDFQLGGTLKTVERLPEPDCGTPG